MKQEKMDDLLKQVAGMEEVPESFNFNSKKVWDELDERLSKRLTKKKDAWYNINFTRVAAALLFLISSGVLVYFLTGEPIMNQFKSVFHKPDINDARFFVNTDLTSDKELSSKLLLLEDKQQELDRLITNYKDSIAIYLRLNQEGKKRIVIIYEKPFLEKFSRIGEYNSQSTLLQHSRSALVQRLLTSGYACNNSKFMLISDLDTIRGYEALSRSKWGLNQMEVRDNGLGKIGFFQSTNAANTFEVQTNRINRAGLLQNTNVNNNSNVLEVQTDGFGNIGEIISLDSSRNRLKYLLNKVYLGVATHGKYKQLTGDYMTANDLNSLNPYYFLGDADRQKNYITIRNPEGVAMNGYNLRLLKDGDDMQIFKLGDNEDMELGNSNDRIILYGHISTDSSGKAVVKLPANFENPNLRFHYQLTVVKSLAKATINKGMSKSNFEIISSEPNVKVNWLVIIAKKVNIFQFLR